METPQTSEKKCSCACHRIVGLFIALIGLTFLLGAFNVLSPKVVEVIWPILLLLVGAKLAAAGSCKCCEKG